MMDKLFAELRRRNVFRVAGVYAVVAWLLVQIVVAIETPLSLPAWTDTLVIVLFGVGFPVAMVLAWAFEMTPEGVKLTANVPKGESIAPKTGRKLDYAILGGVALVAVMFVYDRMTPEPFVTAASQPPQDEGSTISPPHPEEAAKRRHEGCARGLDRGSSVCGFIARQGPGIFLRRHGGGDFERLGQSERAGRRLAHVFVSVQGA